jgi:hypothetical protein
MSSTYSGDWAKMRTEGGYIADSSVGGWTEFFTNPDKKGYVGVAGPSMAYADSRLGYSNLDVAYKDYRGFSYFYTDSDKSIRHGDVIYW